MGVINISVCSLLVPESFMIQISFPSALGCQASLLMLANMMRENSWNVKLFNVVGLLLLSDHMVVTVTSQLVAPHSGKQTKC